MRPRIHPRTIRDLLDEAERAGYWNTANRHGVHPKSMYRWRDRRAASGGVWPTDADIADWESDQAANGAERARRAAQAYRYRQRVYLNRGPTQVDSTGTTRRLQALYALGWTTTQMAARLGVSAARVGHLMNGTYPKLHAATARDVAALYDELSMTVPADPPCTRRGQTRVHDRARREARRRGYAPPLAWNDIDADEAPDGVAPISSAVAADRLAQLQDLDTNRATLGEAAEALGISKKAVWKWCRRNDQLDLYERIAARTRVGTNQYATPGAGGAGARTGHTTRSVA